LNRKKLRAAAVQTRPISDSIEKTILRGVKLARRAAQREADVICLPEHWLPEKKIPTPVDPIPDFQALAEEYGVVIAAGAFYQKVKNKVRLGCPVIGPDGRLLGRQFKVHPFGREKKIATAGNNYEIFTANGFKFGVLVCYDVDFPEASRAFALKGAELLLCPSRIIKEGTFPWHQYVTVRSLENRLPIAAPNVYAPPYFMGHSCIVSLKEDPKRRIAQPRMLSLNVRGEGVLVDDFDLDLHNRLRKARFADRRPGTYN
jgi:predicted amidohydrolase